MPHPYRKNNNRRHFQKKQQQYTDHPDDTDIAEPAKAQEVSLLPLMRNKRLPNEAILIQQEKEKLTARIRSVQNRLMFGYSEPLNDYYIELVKQDLELSCQLVTLLV